MATERIAPRDPTEKRPGFYVLLDKPVGGLPSNDGRGHHPIYINGDRLVTFAKMVGGIQDQAVLDLLRTAAGFRQLVHSVGVSVTAPDPAMTVDFTLGFESERGSAGSRCFCALLSQLLGGVGQVSGSFAPLVAAVSKLLLVWF